MTVQRYDFFEAQLYASEGCHHFFPFLMKKLWIAQVFVDKFPLGGGEVTLLLVVAQGFQLLEERDAVDYPTHQVVDGDMRGGFGEVLMSQGLFLDVTFSHFRNYMG